MSLRHLKISTTTEKFSQFQGSFICKIKTNSSNLATMVLKMGVCMCMYIFIEMCINLEKKGCEKKDLNILFLFSLLPIIKN